MPTTKKRILVVGGGLIGIRHVEAVQAHVGCTFVGLVDPDPLIAPHLKRFADMDDVTETVDGVIIATPTGLHAQHGIYAARRGWPMLIEKPVADDMSGAQALADAVAKAGVASLVGHHRRYHAPVQQLKTLIADGLIGTPICANLIWAMRKPDAYFQGNWRATEGSPVMINLVHDIDTLRFILGDIKAVTGLRGVGVRGGTRLESGAVALGFANGATGSISFADTSPSPWGFEAGTGENPNIGTTGQDMMWIMGTEGAVSFPSLSLWSGHDWGQPAKRVPLKVQANAQSPLAAQLDHFLDVINGAMPLIDVADAMQTLAVTLEIETQLSPAQQEVKHA